jgi:FixJ family two-component response regulator
MQNSSSTLVTVVDDDESVRDALKGPLQSAGFAAAVFSSAEEFLRSSNRDKTSCLILDVHMPAMNGLELQRRLGAQCRIPLIFITAVDDPSTRAQALKAGAVDFLKKPFSCDALLNAVLAALHDENDRIEVFR